MRIEKKAFGNRMFVKIIEDYTYNDLEGMDIFMDTMGYPYRVGMTYYKTANEINAMNPNSIKVKKVGNKFMVSLVEQAGFER